MPGSLTPMAVIAPFLATAPAELHTIVTAVDGLDPAEFAAELQLRLPDRRIIGPGARRPDEGFAYVHVERSDDGDLRVTLVQPDGSAYDRTLPHEPDQAVRVAASSVANLVFSIEGGSAVPDRDDVPIPGPEAEATEGAPPPAVPADPPAPPQQPPPPPPEPPVVEPFIGLTGLLALGLAPAARTGVLAGGGGALDVGIRHRSGGIATLDARVLHRATSELSATRFRLGLGGGYGWRWAQAEVLLIGRLTLEPWWLRRDGGTPTLTLDGEPTTRRPLIGGTATVATGYFHRTRSGVGVHVGPRVELAGSFVPHRGARTIQVDVAAPDAVPTIRMGGLELTVAAGVTLYFARGRVASSP